MWMSAFLYEPHVQLILTWQGRHHDQEGGSPTARLSHCTPCFADPCEFPKCGNLDCIISGSGGLRSRSPLNQDVQVKFATTLMERPQYCCCCLQRRTPTVAVGASKGTKCISSAFPSFPSLSAPPLSAPFPPIPFSQSTLSRRMVPGQPCQRSL